MGGKCPQALLGILVWSSSPRVFLTACLEWGIDHRWRGGEGGRVLGPGDGHCHELTHLPSVQLGFTVSDPHSLSALEEGLVMQLLCCNPWAECSTEGQRAIWSVDF